MNGAIVALFLADTLTLMVGEHLYDDLEHLMPHYWVESGISRLTLSHRGKLVEDLSYTPIDYGIPPELDFTQTDPEDSDYLLWLNNMLSTPERRSGAFRFRRT